MGLDMTPRPVTWSLAEAVTYIARNLRAVDAEEIFGIVENAYRLVDQLALAIGNGQSRIAIYKGKPAGIIGYAHTSDPEVADAFAMGTDQFHRVVPGLTRYALEVLKPSLLANGVKRLQCQSLATHVEAHRWLELFGFKPECTLHGFGRGGKDYIQFVALAEDNAHVFRGTAQYPQAACTAQQAGQPG